MALAAPTMKNEGTNTDSTHSIAMRSGRATSWPESTTARPTALRSPKCVWMFSITTPNTTAMTATTTVSGLRMAGVRRFTVKFEWQKFKDSANALSLNLCQGFTQKTRGSRWVSAVGRSSTQDEAEHAAAANLALDLDAPALTSLMTCGTGVVWKTESALRRGAACATSLQASAPAFSAREREH